MRKFFRSVLAVLLLAPAFAAANFHTFVIDQVYSNASGTIQFVVLREAAGLGGQHVFGGHDLTAGVGNSVQRTYDIPSNLPSSNTANRRVLFATQAFADLGIVIPDYIIPDHFLSQ